MAMDLNVELEFRRLGIPLAMLLNKAIVVVVFAIVVSIDVIVVVRLKNFLRCCTKTSLLK